MHTTSLAIANYCVPCRNQCRYCLLASCYQTSGVSYQRGKRFSERVFSQLRQSHPQLKSSFYIGYCMDTPDLMDYIRFSQANGFPGGRFLQMDGFAFRRQEQWDQLLQDLQAAGIALIDLTFYGTEDYHDRFAGRPGDFAQLCALLAGADRAGLPVRVSMPLIRENLSQADGLMERLQPYHVGSWFFFLPHSKGRGKDLKEQRITQAEFDALSPAVKSRFSTVPYRTEAQWLQALPTDEPTERYLTLVLNAAEMDRLEAMTGDRILADLEAMDDRFQRWLPSTEALARQYGDPLNQQLFRFRDLLLLWQQRFIQDNGGQMDDMLEETHHFSTYL